MLLCVFIIFIVIFLVLIINTVLIFQKYRKLKADISKLYIAVKRVRYGDINVRVENLNNQKIENAANRLFETISDREMMIKEYQTTLSDKNLSLEKIIKQEKELQLLKEEFTATLAHDMKVPVIAELNSLNYLLDGRFGTLNEKQTEIIKLMLSSNQELKDLIENMLETYKLDEKALQLNITNNTINTFIEDIIKDMEPIAVKNSNKIILNLNETKGIKAEFDLFQLKRVLKNILQNAISFSPAKEEITVSSKVKNNTAEINITNKGVGISQEDLNLIFQKYYCGHSKFRKAGTGLGLYLSQQIMLAHNGNIRVDSNKDKTTFIIVLPL